MAHNLYRIEILLINMRNTNKKAIEKARGNARLICEGFEYKALQITNVIDGGSTYSQRLSHLKNELMGKFELIGGEAVSVDQSARIFQPTVTKLRGTASVDLLVVFEIVRQAP